MWGSVSLRACDPSVLAIHDCGFSMGALHYLLCRVIILPVHISCTTSSAGHPPRGVRGSVSPRACYSPLCKLIACLRFLAGRDAYATDARGSVSLRACDLRACESWCLRILVLANRVFDPSQAGTPTLPTRGESRSQGRLLYYARRHSHEAGCPRIA